MKKRIKSIAMLMTALFVMTFSSVAMATSLWSDEVTGSSMSLFSDRKARDVGDVVTIIINETTRTSTSKSTNNSKSGTQDLSAGLGVFHFLAAASASGSDSFDAKGSANSTHSASGMVTVTVVEVHPNGNMVIEGTQSIWQNKNEHKITLRGLIRQDDISSNNTILSTQVADATLKFDGKGPLNAKQRQGILTQIFNILF